MKGFLVGCLLLVSALAAAQKAPSPGEGVRVVKVGTILPLTGPIYVYGNETQGAIQMAFEDFNQRHLGKGLQVQQISRDDQFKPDKTIEAFRDLSGDNQIVALIGSLTSNCTLAIGSRAQAGRIPLITPTSTNDHIAEAGNYVFQACYRDGFQGSVAASFAIGRLGARKAVVLTDPDNDYSTGLSQSFTASFQGAGRAVTTVSYFTKQTDFATLAQKVKSLDPDVVFFTDYYEPVGKMVQALREAGVQSAFVGSDAWDDVVSHNLETAEGAYYVNHYSTELPGPENQQFVRAYKNRWGKLPDALAALGYDAARILLDAIDRASVKGEVSREAIRNELEATNAAYSTGHIRFTSGHQTWKTAVMLQIVKSGAELRAQYIGVVEPD